MRIVVIVASWIGIILLPIVVVSSILMGLFFNASFYRVGQEKYHVQSVTGMSPAEIVRTDQGIVRFFASTESLPDALSASGASPDVFKQKEVLHMNDVRVIVWFIGKAQIVGLILIVALAGLSLLRWRKGGRAAMSRVLLCGAVLTVGLVVLSGILTYTSFDSLFLTFHEMTFQNNFWELDPRTDHLIQLFPFGFWYDAMLTVAWRVLLVTIALGICGGILGRLGRRRT